MLIYPSAKMPTVPLPAAAPFEEAVVAEPPATATLLAYVYLLRTEE